MRSALLYRPIASPLHSTRAVVGTLWLACLGAAALILDHPLALSTILLVILATALMSGLSSQMRGVLRLIAMVALPIVFVNVLVSREGLTVFARLGDLGPFGQGDLTVEALVYGVVFALKVSIFILLGVLGSLAIDPDELIARAMGLSFRSALTASVAIRMLPLLAADAQRFADAQRTRQEMPSRGSMRRRALLLGASFSSALDRSLDIAATLELRGFCSAKRAAGRRRPLSRHDISFSVSALAILALALLGTLAHPLSFQAYPLIHMPISAATVALCAAIALAALLPLLDRRGLIDGGRGLIGHSGLVQ